MGKLQISIKKDIPSARDFNSKITQTYLLPQVGALSLTPLRIGRLWVDEQWLVYRIRRLWHTCDVKQNTNVSQINMNKETIVFNYEE
jgi:hypothetical protein